MAFREGSAGPEVSQLESFSSGPKYAVQKTGLSAVEVVDGGPDAAELDEPSNVAEPVLVPSSPTGEDPVRLYLKEIGKVPLLKAEEEVMIGQRIEVGQIALRRTLGSIPMA